MAGEKPKKSSVSTRLDPETLTRMDGLKEYFSSNWRKANRTDVFRALVLDGLERFEKLRAEGDPEALQEVFELHGGSIKKKAKSTKRRRSRKKS